MHVTCKLLTLRHSKCIIRLTTPVRNCKKKQQQQKKKPFIEHHDVQTKGYIVKNRTQTGTGFLRQQKKSETDVPILYIFGKEHRKLFYFVKKCLLDYSLMIVFVTGKSKQLLILNTST